MRHRLGRQAAALFTAAALALSSTAVMSAAVAAPSPAGVAPAGVAAAPVDPTIDPTGGKTVVGQTSPIHDPALIIDDDGTWYVYSTGRINRENGGTIQIATSKDSGTTWTYSGTVWDSIPTWIDEHFAGETPPENLWAPEIYENDGTYYLYYSASVFGEANSITALATNTTLDPADPDYEWVDQGLVIASPVTGLEGDKKFNAIDAGIVEDDEGNPFMAIGSFWYGIFLVPLEWPTGMPVKNWQAETVHIADRFMPGNPIEAPYITKRDGYYYLFVSFGNCCQGENSTYQVAVGRSTTVDGPYLDKEGRDMFGGGGTIVLEKHGAMVGPGGQSLSGDYLAFHYYDASNEAIPYFPTLGIQKLAWVDGWPVADQTVELPAVTIEPTATSVVAGSPATFTLTATGTPAPVAEWETSSDAGDTWVAVTPQPVTTPTLTGVTSTLTFLATDAAQDGLLVRARVSNAHGSTTSAEVALTVTAIDLGDGDEDGNEDEDGNTDEDADADADAVTPGGEVGPGAGSGAPVTPTTPTTPVIDSGQGITTVLPTTDGSVVAGTSALARTGSEAPQILLAALALTLIGAAAVAATRHRRIGA